MQNRALCLCMCTALLIGSGFAADVPFVFDDTPGIANYTSVQLEQARFSSSDLSGVPIISTPPDNQSLEFPAMGGGNTPADTIEKNVGELKRIVNSRVEPNNVHEQAIGLAGKYSGDYTIEQVCAIYSDLKEDWHYVPDPRGMDYFSYANASLKVGEKSNCIGAGDCDDFAILMSALIESIRGTTRIVLARNNTTGGHAFTEVYIGQLDAQDNRVELIINWLKDKFDADKIYTHIDTDSKDVWLNLDWGSDEEGNTHPGGPFFQGDRHIVIRINNNTTKTIPNIPEKPNKKPRLISLTPDKNSPLECGNAINWTAEAKDAEKDPIMYRFFLNDDPVTKWSEKNMFIWNTTEDDVDDYRIEVRIRDTKHAGPDGFDSRRVANFTVTTLKPKASAPENRTPVINSLAADKLGPQHSGTAITWTAEAIDPDKDQLFFRFLLNDGPVTEWTTVHKWIWNTTDDDLGDNRIEVQIRDGRHAGLNGSDSNRTANFAITMQPKPEPEAPSNQNPIIESLALDKSSPQESGTSVTWTASAYDPDNDSLLYRFLLNGRNATDWTGDNVWIWTSTEKDAGTNRIEVQVRDGKHAGANACDDSAAADFRIAMPNQPPVLTEFTAEPESSQPSGTTVRWMAIATDPDSDALYYRYYLMGPSTDNVLKIVRDWSKDNTWIWTTFSGDVGISRIQVWVRDDSHAGTDGWDDQQDASFTVLAENVPPTVSSLNPDPASPQDAGTQVVWTAFASDADGDTLLYRFLLNDRDVTDWSHDNSWAMKTTKDDEGENHIEVQVRDGMHAGPDGFDAEMSASFTVNRVEAQEAQSGVTALGGSKKHSYVPGPAYTNRKPSFVPGYGVYPIGTN
ncbi:MAG: transglutaminase domain-containing protein [Methanothrix sp.]